MPATFLPGDAVPVQQALQIIAARQQQQQQAPPVAPPPPQAQPSYQLPEVPDPAAVAAEARRRNAAAAVQLKAARGEQLAPEEIGLLDPEAQQALAVRERVNAPVYVPGRAGQEEAIIPTTSSETYEGPANVEEQRAAYGQAAKSRAQAITMRRDVEEEKLQQQLVQARAQRAQMEREVAKAEQQQAYVTKQQDLALTKARQLQSAVEQKQVDPGRLFRKAPWAVIMAVLTDTLNGYRGLPSNVTGSVIDRDTAAQEAELMKLRSDADNSLKFAIETYDGDVQSAKSALNIAKAQAVKNSMMEQSAQLGLAENDARTAELFAGLDEYIAKQTAELGASARTRASQSYVYQPEIKATPGYMREATSKEKAERLRTENDFLDELSRYKTGYKRKELSDAERSDVKAIADRDAQLGQRDMQTQQLIYDELKSIDKDELAIRTFAEATGGTFNEETGKWEWVKRDPSTGEVIGRTDMRGYWRGPIAGRIGAATGVPMVMNPSVKIAAENLRDLVGRDRSGAAMPDSEKAIYQRLAEGVGTEEDVEFATNLMNRYHVQRKQRLRAAFPGAVEAFEERQGMLRNPKALIPEPK